jgi:hypothetical protein
LALVTGCAFIGGFLIMLTNGYEFPKWLGGKKFKPWSDSIKIPPIIMMIVFGCLIRNFGGDYLENYNDEWGTYIRMICLSVILL